MMRNKILVLNGDYTPISVTTFKRAFKLAFKGKAEVLSHQKDLDVKVNLDDEYYLQLLDQCPTLLASSGGFKRPTIIRLLKRVTVPYRKVPLSRQNIYRRDGNACVYCGENNVKKLTLDHVIPKSKGGPNTWMNLVTCCGKCNVEKGDTYMEEMGYTMLVKPYRPSYLQFINRISGADVREEWKKYLFS